MSKYRFNKKQRLVVWERYDGECYWCGEPVPLADVTIDHVLPESLADDEPKFQEAKSNLRLPADFDLNSFANWVPAHQRCNRAKSNSVFSYAPYLLVVLESVRKKAIACERYYDKLCDDQDKDALLGRIESAMESGILTISDLSTLLTGSSAEQEGREPKMLHLTDRWKIVRRSDYIEYVTDGVRTGFRSIHPSRDASWSCPFCGCEGPWNGVICMSCGMRSEPD